MKFWKMHGLGNDYVVIDNREQIIGDAQAPALAKKLCERRFSIGADGLLLVSNSLVADVKMRIFNADGSEAEMCGNGIRCFSKFCYETGVVRKGEFAVETLAGLKRVWLTLKDNEVKLVKVDMGAPSWDRKDLPMVGQGLCVNEDLQVDEDEIYKVTCLSMGNPHCIIFVENVDESPVEYIGPMIESHKAFPNRTNVGFVQVLNKNELKVRVWERG
jgi:diaminopimelate epimerase